MLKPPRRPSTLVRYSRSSMGPMSPKTPLSPTSPYSPVMTSELVTVQPGENAESGGLDVRSPRPASTKFSFDLRKSGRISSTEC